MRKENTNKKNRQKAKFGIYIAALITAAGVFAVMTYLQKEALSDFEKKEIFVSACEIPRGIVITEENAEHYLVLKSVDAGCVPPGAADSLRDFIGSSPVFDIGGGTLLTGEMFSSSEEVMNGMESPVLAGFKTDDLSKAVSGVLRAGDLIDIYVTDPETGEGSLLCGNVYVESGYDINGNRVSDSSAAVMFNIYLESSDAADFYDGLMSGSLYVVKACNRPPGAT